MCECVHRYMYVHTNGYKKKYLLIYMYVKIFMYITKKSIYVYIYMKAYVCIYICTHTYIRICINVYIHIYIMYIYRDIDVDLHRKRDRDRTYHMGLFPQKSPVGFQLPNPFSDNSPHKQTHTTPKHILSHTHSLSLYFSKKTLCNTLQVIACNTLQLTATHCNSV